MKTVKMVTMFNLVPYTAQLCVEGLKQETFTFAVTADAQNFELPSARVAAQLLKKHFGKGYVEHKRYYNIIYFTVGKLNGVERNVLLALLTSYIKFK